MTRSFVSIRKTISQINLEQHPSFFPRKLPFPPPKLQMQPHKHDSVLCSFHGRQFRLSHLCYLTFVIVGIALLWPWNCFLSASAYYGERFSNSPLLIKIYSSTMMSVSTIASTVYNYYLSQAQTGVRYYFRLNLGLGITIVVFIIMAISCISEFFITMADPVFFTVLMGMVLVSAMATCLAQNGTMAIVNVLGGIYANAVMVGQAVAGVLPAMALIISILVVGDKPLDQKDQVEKDYGTFVYYITASLISIASVLLLVTTHRLKEQATYLSLTELVDDDFTNCPTEHDLQEVEPAQSTHVPFGLLWDKLKLIVSSIFLIFSITLIFPVFASVIQSNNEVSGKWYFQKNVYIPFIYLIWNLGDLMGRVLCGIPRYKMLISDPRRLIMYSVARLAFIPLFLTCNLHPQAGESSAWIKSDLWYIALQFVFGLTNGQLCTSCFMIVRDYCDTDEEKEAAGGFTTVFLSVGLAVGAVLSYLLVWFIS